MKFTFDLDVIDRQRAYIYMRIEFEVEGSCDVPIHGRVITARSFFSFAFFLSITYSHVGV